MDLSFPLRSFSFIKEPFLSCQPVSLPTFWLVIQLGLQDAGELWAFTE